MRLGMADPSDAYELQLRAEDSREVTEGWRQRVALAILDDNCMAARDEQGHLVALWGVTLGDTTGVPWMLSSPLIEHHKATAWRTARRFVKHLLRPAQRNGFYIFNFIPKDSHSNRRFVQALGFRIHPSPGEGADIFYLPCANQQP